MLLTNSGEACLAAGLIRYLSDQPSHFDTLRRISIFIAIGGFLAPFVSTFPDAAFVTLILGEDYWTVFKMRWLSNTLAQLAIVPAVAGLINHETRLADWPRRRWLNAAAIAGALVLAAFAVSSDLGEIGLSRAPLAPFIPILLLAAVRFGAIGVSLSVLATALLIVESTTVGDGLLRVMAQVDQTIALQLFLIASTVPLLCVGALMEELHKTQETVRANDVWKSTILASIPSLVVVVNRDGRVVAVNEQRIRFLTKNIVPGDPYLDDWAKLAESRFAHAWTVYEGIRSVLDRTAPAFTFEYSYEIDGSTHWWLISVVPLKSAEGGAVVTHTDITARKRAELEIQRSRDELAHVARLWVMGELTASLSHQLSQPLSGIIGNAYAGRRFLEAKRVNLGEVQQIFTDIITDAERAGEVTRAVRDMLRKGSGDRALVDLNDVVRDMAALLASETLIRRVSLRLELTPPSAPVHAERVQVRQVVLNLIMNAIEAVAAQADADRRVVTVSTAPCGGVDVRLSVADTGEGLPSDAEERVFDPLFTTKESGMGMGLPIARGIVEALGGTIHAANSSTGGAVFHVTLPLAFDQPL
jgi:signal transduction histidine kinase